MTRLRIYLADDHEVVREGLRSLISAQDDMEVVGQAADGATAVEEATRLAPDVVVMDVSMPERDGASAAEDIKLARPAVKLLALTVHENKAYIRRLLAAGASGYVLKRSAAAELIRAIRTVAAGGVYLDPSLVETVLVDFVKEPGRPEAQTGRTLSGREEQVLRLIAKGLTGKEIAARFEISVKTVETHKHRAMEKLGLSGRAEVVRHALHNGWLDD
ncbi:response regulator [Paludisphaera soli]|uniref:response regulator n=1 Tax=Paludisphaera soli TaxID=2712865 RepID=UPI0013EA2A8E|nr:response regulator transcription factor [Paludisphaera soli]